MNCSIPLAAGVCLVLLSGGEALVTGVPLLAAADAHHSPNDVNGGNSLALYDDISAVSAVQTKLTKINKITPLWAVSGQASKAPEAGYAAARNATIAQVAPAHAVRPAATEPPDGVVDIVVASKERPAAGGAKRQEAPSSEGRHDQGPGLVSVDSSLKQKEQEGSRGGAPLLWLVGGGILFVVLPAMFFFGCLSLSSQINSPGLVAGAVANVLGRFRTRREQPHRTDRAEEAPESPPGPPPSALYSRRAAPPPPPVHTASMMASQVYGSKHVHFHVAPSFASAPSSSSGSEQGLRSTPDAPKSPPSPYVVPPFMGQNFKAADSKLPGPECYYIGDSRPMLGSYRAK